MDLPVALYMFSGPEWANIAAVAVVTNLTTPFTRCDL